MKRLQKFVFLVMFTGFLFCTAANLASVYHRKPQQKENHAPVVKIVKPKSQTEFDVNAQVNYSITVSDKEDGDSKFDELNTKEVLLQVQYIGDAAKAQVQLTRAVQNDAPGLAIMRTSNCFNCHNFTGKLIGPSFYDICKKYPATAANIAAVAKRVKEGSSGIWGKVIMPTHPELTKEQTQTIVQWILKSAASPDVNYFIGTAGNFRLPQKGSFLLTASYIDHGLKEDSTHRLRGEDRVVVSGK